MKNLLLFLICITFFSCTQDIKSIPKNDLKYETVVTLEQVKDSCNTSILINDENCYIKTSKDEYYVIKQYDVDGYIFAFLIGVLLVLVIVVIVVHD